MVAKALDHGINFFDNAWEYHQGLSEELVRAALNCRPESASLRSRLKLNPALTGVTKDRGRGASLSAAKIVPNCATIFFTAQNIVSLATKMVKVVANATTFTRPEDAPKLGRKS